MIALALCQAAGRAAATESDSFAVTVRVANACETNGQCATAIVRVLGTPVNSAAVVTPLAPTADRDAGQRIDTRQDDGPVEVDF